MSSSCMISGKSLSRSNLVIFRPQLSYVDDSHSACPKMHSAHTCLTLALSPEDLTSDLYIQLNTFHNTHRVLHERSTYHQAGLDSPSYFLPRDSRMKHAEMHSRHSRHGDISCRSDVAIIQREHGYEWRSLVGAPMVSLC